MALLLLAFLGANSQAPGILNYQGVARNSVGNVLANKTITLRLTIHNLTAGGAVVYQESRQVTTNPFGLFNVQVGSPGASNITGTIAGVPWAVGNKYIQVEIDPNGGTTFINIGTAQVASVPYALYATLAGDLVLPFNKTQADNGTLFTITNSGNATGSAAIEGLTNSTQSNAFAMRGTVTSTTPGSSSAGVIGQNNGTGGLGIGVIGQQNGSGWGVYGFTPSGIGVYGVSNSGNGVTGFSTLAYGVSGSTNASNGAGVLGDGTGTGVSSGVMGRSGEGAYPGIATNAGVTGRANANVGVAGYAITGIGGRFSSQTGKALFTAGGVQLTGINEGLNKVLASDAVGNATWQTLGAIGGVTGSGTVNYVPKWTPITTNLGNSQIFDDGTNVGINIAAPLGRLHVVSSINSFASQDFYFDNNSNALFSWSQLALRSTGSAPKLEGIKFIGTANNNATIFFNEGGIFANHLTLSIDNNGNIPNFSINKANGNVGVNLVNAAAKLHVGANSVVGTPQLLLEEVNDDDFARLNFKTTHANNSGNNFWAIAGYNNNTRTSERLNFYNNATGNLLTITGDARIGVNYANPVANSINVIGVTGQVWSGTQYYNPATGSTFFDGFYVGQDNNTSVGPVDLLNYENTDMLFFTNGAQRMTIKNTGELDFFNALRPGGNAGTLNQVLASNGAGVAPAWKSAAAAGLVSGSGTLNYIPKWTPNGTTLGNSQVFDNGVAVGIGTVAPANLFEVINGGNVNAGNFVNTNAGNTVGALRGLNSATNIGSWGVHALSVSGTGYPGEATYAALVAAATTGVGIITSSPSNYGLRAGSIGNNAIYGENYGTMAGVMGAGLFANSYGVVGNAAAGTGAGGYFTGGTTALRTLGGVQLTGIGEANGYILTSDASGNATWQDATATRVAFAVRGISAPVAVPFFTWVPISQWQTIDYEEGSFGNYNGGTGEYTIPKTGKYHVAVEVLFNQPGASGGGYAGVGIFVNGVSMDVGEDNMTTANLFSGIKATGDLNLNSGDLVSIQVFHNTSGSPMIGANFDHAITNWWSIHLIK